MFTCYLFVLACIRA